MKINFGNFKCKNEFPKQLRLEKQMEKMGSFVWFSRLHPQLWSLNCQQLCPVCNYILMPAKHPRSLYASGKILFCFLENGIGYYAMT